MGSTDKKLEERLLCYVEARDFGGDGLSEDEMAEIDRWIENNECAREEARSISAYLQRLRDLPSPQPSDTLATRCVEAVCAPRENVVPGWLKWCVSGALGILLVFGAGVWFGGSHREEPKDPFLVLLRYQNLLTSRLEVNLARHYETDRLDSGSPWQEPIAYLSETTDAIATYYEEHSSDPVIRRSLSMAVAQNIRVLRDLCRYLETGGEIMDYDVRSIDITEFSEKSSI